MTPSLLEQFKTKFESLSGRVHLARSWDEAARHVWGICQDCEASCLALAGVPMPLQEALETLCTENGAECLTPPYAHDALPGAIDAVQVGVTGADFAIAQTGTLVEVALNDATRLVSALPRTHIAVVSQRELVATLEDAAPRLRRILSTNRQHCVISFLSGPSRTGDIEITLTLGVHGPEAAHTIVLDETLIAENAGG